MSLGRKNSLNFHVKTTHTQPVAPGGLVVTLEYYYQRWSLIEFGSRRGEI